MIEDYSTNLPEGYSSWLDLYQKIVIKLKPGTRTVTIGAYLPESELAMPFRFYNFEVEYIKNKSLEEALEARITKDEVREIRRIVDIVGYYYQDPGVRRQILSPIIDKLEKVCVK